MSPVNLSHQNNEMQYMYFTPRDFINFNSTNKKQPPVNFGPNGPLMLNNAIPTNTSLVGQPNTA